VESIGRYLVAALVPEEEGVSTKHRRHGLVVELFQLVVFAMVGEFVHHGQELGTVDAIIRLLLAGVKDWDHHDYNI